MKTDDSADGERMTCRAADTTVISRGDTEYNEVKRSGVLRWLTFGITIILIPATILAGMYLFNDRRYYMISLLMICYMLAAFFLMFERKKPRAREVVVLSVMTALAVAGRAAFFMIPQFKPVTALIIITGVCLGAEAGFITGALTAFISNFLLAQGPWTPWQMFALGSIGFLSGLIFEKKVGKMKRSRRNIILCIYGFISTLVIYGGIVDIWTILAVPEPTLESVLSVYTLALPLNIIHCVSAVFFMLLFANPMIEKLERARIKYGLMGG